MPGLTEIVVGKYSEPRRPPIFYDPSAPPTVLDGVVHVFRRVDVTRVLQNEEQIFSRQLGPRIADPHPTFTAPWGLDWYPANDMPGRHSDLRAVIEPWFRTTAVRTLGTDIEVALNRLIDKVIADGAEQFDLATDIAYPLALEAAGLLLGLDLDDADWRAKLDTHVSASDFESIPRQHDVDAAIWQIVAERLLTGRSRGQLVDRLIDAWRAGEIDRSDIVPIIWMSLAAATDTTAASLVSMIGLLDEFDLLDRVGDNLSDDQLVTGAVEEALRLGQVFDSAATLCTAATRIGDIDVAPYTLVVAWYSAANRDTERGDEFDITRRPNPHVTFGPPRDPHVCLGSAMARYILKLALRTLLSRLPALRRDHSKPTVQTLGIANSYRTAPFSYRPSSFGPP